MVIYMKIKLSKAKNMKIKGLLSSNPIKMFKETSYEKIIIYFIVCV